MSDHGAQEIGQDFKVSPNAYPFVRSLMRVGGSFIVRVPPEYVKVNNLRVGDRVQLYIEVRRGV